MNDRLLPLVLIRRSGFDGPAFRSVHGISRIVSANSSQLVSIQKLTWLTSCHVECRKLLARRPARSKETSWTQAKELAWADLPYKSSINVQSDMSLCLWELIHQGWLSVVSV